MPFALVIIGLTLLVASVRNTQSVGPNGGPGLFGLVQGDFTGPNNFVYWFLAMIIIGAIGYVPKLKAFSNAMLALVIVVLFLKKGTGFFAQFQKAISTTQTASVANASSGITNGLISSLGGGSLLTGSTGILGTGSIPSLGSSVPGTSTGVLSPIAGGSPVSPAPTVGNPSSIDWSNG